MKENQDTHGYSGPLKVSLNSTWGNVPQDFLDVAAGYDPTRKTTDDPNALTSCNEYAVSLLIPSIQGGGLIPRMAQSDGRGNAILLVLLSLKSSSPFIIGGSTRKPGNGLMSPTISSIH